MAEVGGKVGTETDDAEGEENEATVRDKAAITAPFKLVCVSLKLWEGGASGAWMTQSGYVA
jgi:hypothetical protein